MFWRILLHPSSGWNDKLSIGKEVEEEGILGMVL
jgi:hypothetical protein